MSNTKDKKKSKKKKSRLDLDELRDELEELIASYFVEIDGQAFPKKQIDKIHKEWIKEGRIR
jgi:hypothetical protein